jgi:hypothetical protein
VRDERTKDPSDEEASAARQAADEPEPAWAAQIRALRKARGDRLKSLLGTDDEDEGTTP